MKDFAGRIKHLAGRFFEVLSARPLSPREQGEVEALLRPGERDLFWEQPVADQRHGLEAARRVLAVRPGDRSLARAALLHDVGKRHAGLGIIGRSLASGLELVGLRPPVEAWRRYLDHGALGAADLEAVGAEPIVVSFARHHHGGRPESVGPEDWAVLGSADLDQKARRRRSGPIH